MKVREGRQLAVSSSGETTIEGDIVLRDSALTDPRLLDAHLANPDRLWPSGVVEYRFYNLLEVLSERQVPKYLPQVLQDFPCLKQEVGEEGDEVHQ